MPAINLPTTFGIVRSRMNDNGMRKNNFGASAGPTATDNAAAGYEIGSAWITTSGARFILTAFSGSNAVWSSAAPSWNEVTGKPSTFAPSAHNHAVSDVNGLQTLLDEKAPASTIWTLEQIQDAIAAMFQGGTHTNATVTYDDTAGTISLTASGGGGGGTLTQEQVEDMVGNLVVQGTGITVFYDDPNNLLRIALTGESYTTAEKNKLAAIAAGATANASDSALRDRSTHNGTQAISTVSGLQTALDAKLLASLVSAFALTLLDDADAGTMRATLGLAALATLATVGTGQITNGAVTNTKQANMPATTIKGNSGASAAAPSDLTVSQLKTLLALAIADVSGLQSALNGKTNGAYTIWSGTQAAFNGTTPTNTTISYITA